MTAGSAAAGGLAADTGVTAPRVTLSSNAAAMLRAARCGWVDVDADRMRHLRKARRDPRIPAHARYVRRAAEKSTTDPLSAVSETIAVVVRGRPQPSQVVNGRLSCHGPRMNGSSGQPAEPAVIEYSAVGSGRPSTTDIVPSPSGAWMSNEA